jgi:hypothetical protein
VNLANTSQMVSFSNVHWIYNNLYADKVYSTPFGVGRNTLTGPISQGVDLSVFKDFTMRENVGTATTFLLRPPTSRLESLSWERDRFLGLLKFVPAGETA